MVTGETLYHIDLVNYEGELKAGHGWSNHIVGFYDGGTCIFNPTSSTWVHSNKNALFMRNGIQCSSVYARDNIYVFGGDGPNIEDSYVWYSLVDQKWSIKNIVGPSVEGGSNISACFDGQRFIYLVGGTHKGYLLNRVDCFDVETGTFRHVGTLPYHFKSAVSFFQNGIIYIVGGYDKEDKNLGAIFTFNTLNLGSNKLFRQLPTYVDNKKKMSACFDGKDRVYLSSNGWFHYILLSSLGGPFTLTSPPLTTFPSDFTLFFVPGFGPTLCDSERISMYNTMYNNWEQIYTGKLRDIAWCHITAAAVVEDTT
ncbi:hypothetical protein SAMD00019534_109290 [Acytostelium subglobosum LB1]|uniref:hypothetical protein n=1 Tax=Acytostelium subglobosum LB1 TaxID=1410327 RepID=UPI000644C64A|nr:hypothetical protein SAMD00019534_109290 [Acytostelium subglobosum LB1]GAM27753.1 hypothetical protein SAMD00019534_109290 [Acytostelium subglobosum LB1]|eukprot:XP_012749412.1 hypothetical protein SAMD00019534_109290 [Acytostelium subglobosum LB1]